MANSLSELIQRIYSKSNNKDILEEPKNPPVEQDLKWVGRDQQIEKLKEALWDLLQACSRQEANVQAYAGAVIFGAVGIGKVSLINC